jgi:hypothetical protein
VRIIHPDRATDTNPHGCSTRTHRFVIILIICELRVAHKHIYNVATFINNCLHRLDLEVMYILKLVLI